MFKNCVFRADVNTVLWMRAALRRSVKTMAQTAVAMLPAAATITAVDWRTVVGTALLAGVAEKQLFGALLRRLQVRDEDLYELCCNAWQNPTFGEAPTAQVVGTRVAASDILSDIFGDAAPAAPVQETAATARGVSEAWKRLRASGVTSCGLDAPGG